MRDLLQLFLATLAILALGGLGYQLIFGGTPARELVITELQGAVRLEAEALSSPAQLGHTLAARERLITGDDGRVSLSLEGDSMMTLEPSGSLEIIQLTEEGVSIELENGRIQAEVRPGSGRVSLLHGDRRVSASDAAFVLAVDAERDTLGVSLREGELDLAGFEESTLKEGWELLVLGDVEQAAPEPLVLPLSVSWPPAATREPEAVITGQTQAGASLILTHHEESQRLHADLEGGFILKVALREGENPLHLSARNVLGAVAQSQSTVTLDSQAPSATIQIRY